MKWLKLYCYAIFSYVMLPHLYNTRPHRWHNDSKWPISWHLVGKLWSRELAINFFVGKILQQRTFHTILVATFKAEKMLQNFWLQNSYQRTGNQIFGGKFSLKFVGGTFSVLKYYQRNVGGKFYINIFHQNQGGKFSNLINCHWNLEASFVLKICHQKFGENFSQQTYNQKFYGNQYWNMS